MQVWGWINWCVASMIWLREEVRTKTGKGPGTDIISSGNIFLSG